MIAWGRAFSMQASISLSRMQTGEDRAQLGLSFGGDILMALSERRIGAHQKQILVNQH